MVYVILLFVMFTTNFIPKLPRRIFEVTGTREKAVGTFLKNAYFQRPRSREPGIPRGRPAQKITPHWQDLHDGVGADSLARLSNFIHLGNLYEKPLEYGTLFYIRGLTVSSFCDRVIG